MATATWRAECCRGKETCKQLQFFALSLGMSMRLRFIDESCTRLALRRDVMSRDGTSAHDGIS